MTPADKQEAELDARAREHFRKLDLNHDGQLSMHELQVALHDAKVPVTQSQVEALYHLIANKQSDRVELEDFLIFAAQRRKALRNAFVEICQPGAADSEPTGTTRSSGEAYFTAGHLRRAAERAKIPLSDRNVRDIMAQIDRNHDGSVTYDEFVQSLMLVPHINPHVFFDRWFVEVFDDLTIGFRFPREVRTREGEDFSSIAIRKISCGALAGVFSRSLTAPLDRIRLLMMTSTTPLGIASAYQTAVSHPAGLWALWMGNGISCVKIAPEMALKLYTFDALKTVVAQDPDNVSTMERFVAGGCAGALAEFAVYPIDVLRTRMATGLYESVSACVKAVRRDGGARAFFAGIAPSITGIVPYAAIDLCIFSTLKDMVVTHFAAESEEMNVQLLLACGMASSATAATLTFPVMVIRTKAQATNMPVVSVIRKLRSEGIRGFYRGLAPSLMAVMPATSISYAAYEWLNGRWASCMG